MNLFEFNDHCNSIADIDKICFVDVMLNDTHTGCDSHIGLWIENIGSICISYEDREACGKDHKLLIDKIKDNSQ